MATLRGIWLEVRVIPVLLWSYSALTLGTALAWHSGAHRDLRLYAAAIALGVLIQGLLAHTVNEIADWRSGTDRHDSPRVISGGSKVVRLGLLGEAGLWRLFAVAFTATTALGLLLAWRQGWVLLLWGLAGVVGAIIYTLPPVRAAYRPVLGEAIAFGCVVLCVTGAYRLAGRLPGALELETGAAVAAYAVAMLMMHHYLDHDADAAAVPRKVTSIVWLGRANGHRYGTAWAVVAVAAATASAVAEPRLWPLAIGYALAVPIHLRCDPTDVASVTQSELRVILIGIASAIAAAAVLTPLLAVAAVPAVLLVAAELKIAPPPPSLAGP